MLFIAIGAHAQKKEKKQKPGKIKLTNALVIGQLDTPEDRYSLEINLTDLLARKGIKAVPSLNVLKLGADSQQLATDSVQQAIKAKGIDTYMLVSIRGYDRKYRVGNLDDSFETALGQASFFELYREGIVSISFQIKIFRDGKCVAADMIKCGNIGDRDTVLRRLRKKLNKVIDKKYR